ncbi:MAG: class D sortase [Lactobacillales bacterium]|nr:class D sortase [Lactobacillales bacterium]
MPLIFMIVGYFIINTVGKPVIDFAKSTTSLLLLNDKPDFQKKSVNLYDGVDNQKSDDGKLLASQITYPKVGDRYGEVIIDKVDIKTPLFYGDSTDVLAQGAGMYANSKFPGEMGTTIIGGHNQPIFGNIYYLQVGDEFVIKTNYGEFTYRVIETKIIQSDDPMVLEELGQTKEQRAFLYTCYPLDAIGWARDRAIVIGKQISGPTVDEHH